jgi:hypothetical protein
MTRSDYDSVATVYWSARRMFMMPFNLEFAVA